MTTLLIVDDSAVDRQPCRRTFAKNSGLTIRSLRCQRKRSARATGAPRPGSRFDRPGNARNERAGVGGGRQARVSADPHRVDDRERERRDRRASAPARGRQLCLQAPTRRGPPGNRGAGFVRFRRGPFARTARAESRLRTGECTMFERWRHAIDSGPDRCRQLIRSEAGSRLPK